MIGLFANFAAHGTFAENRNMQMVARQGWSTVIDRHIKHRIEWGVQSILWHLPAGRDEPGVMDFDGFAEIRKALAQGDFRWRNLHQACFQGALIELHHQYPELTSVIYFGSLVRDQSMLGHDLGSWLARIEAELAVITSLPIEPHRLCIAFDDLTSRKQDVPRVGYGDPELRVLDDYRGMGYQCLAEPHPHDEDDHFFDHIDGFVVVDNHWTKANAKRITQRRCRGQLQKPDGSLYDPMPVHMICTSFDRPAFDPSKTIWDVVKDDPAVVTHYVPWARFDSFIQDGH